MMVWSQIRLLLLLALVSVPVFGQDPDLTLIKERELEAVRDKIRRYREDPGGHDPGAAGVGLVARETTSAWRRTDRYGM